MEELRRNWVDRSEDDDDQLVQELLSDASPFFPIPQESTESNSSPSNDSPIDRMKSVAYSGPTIGDTDSALSATTHISQPEELSQARIHMVDGGGLSKAYEHKYTLRIRSCGNAMADDGYKWRKYGQKFIKNSPFPRSYYRCTNPRCGAKKQAERSSEDPETLVITYEGLHLHYVYPFFLSNEHNQAQDDSPPKKFKKSTSENQSLEAQHEQPSPENDKPTLDHFEIKSQGLLEDVVPLTVRKPSMNATNSNSSSCCSYPSTPSSPSILSWSPIYCSPLGFDLPTYEDLVTGD